MRKLFGILALTAIFGTAMAQEGGNFQVTAILGKNPMFNTGYMPLPKYSVDETGLYDQSGNQRTVETFLNVEGFSSTGVSSVTNMAGVQLAYYLGPIDVNLMYAADLSITPKKDYVPAKSSELYSAEDIADPSYDLFRQPDQKQVNGVYKSNWYLNVGGNFHVENKRANGYGGVRLGYKKSRYETVDALNEAATNESYPDYMLHNTQTKEGTISAFQPAIVAGAECVANCGMVFGVEFLPFAYQYSVIEIDPDGQYHYACSHHSVKFFSTPTLKLGVRF